MKPSRNYKKPYPPLSIWDAPNRRERFAELWNQEPWLSSVKIAHILTLEFKIPITKNAVIGLAGRSIRSRLSGRQIAHPMNLVSRRRTREHSSIPKIVSKPIIPIIKPTPPILILKTNSFPVEKIIAINPPNNLITPIDKPLYDYTNSQCRWPMWGDKQHPTHVYCSNKRMPDSSYCLEHRKITTQKTAPQWRVK